MKGSRWKRVSTGLPAVDRVLGGGLVEGSTILLAARPGTGMSTLTLQILDGLEQPCLYVTGEETLEHVKTRARRIGAVSNQISMSAETSLGEILLHARSMRARAVTIDSIQMLSCGYVKGRPGAPSQLRECMARLIDYAKTTNTTLWLIGHLTQRDIIAGPQTIEHDVDVVLRLLRLDQEGNARFLSCHSKNRFGSTDVVGRLELTARGFVEG